MAREAENIGARMKELREGLGLTQRELAEKLPGKTEGKDISRWENGKHRPSPDTLAAIADALGTTLQDLHAGPLAGRKDKGPTPDPFAVSQSGPAGADPAARERAAIERHSEVMLELGKIRTLLEAQGKTGQRGGRKKASGQ